MVSDKHTSALAASLADGLRDRFMRYVTYDTQALPGVDSYPSTSKQLELSRHLVDELRDVGIEAYLDDDGYVIGTVEATVEHDVPVIGFLAHVDTSPEAPGAGVRPQLITDYAGGDIVLAGDTSQVIRVEEHPELDECVGRDIITSDGTTLLGADDKAGVAAIVTAAAYLVEHPELRHGRLRLAFTPDEEVGRGVERLDIDDFGAAVAYTLDGGTAGEIQDETFAAMEAEVEFIGSNTHPGYAKNKMKNAVRAAAAFVALLPIDESPEETDGRTGFIHPFDVDGSVGHAILHVLLRDFDHAALERKAARVEELAQEAAERWGVGVDVKVRHQYSNMKVYLDDVPLAMGAAEEAVSRAGLQPRRTLIRGGTDGALLSAKGLPTPNLFVGMHGIHSLREWICVQDMADAAATVIHLAQVWAERGSSGT